MQSRRLRADGWARMRRRRHSRRRQGQLSAPFVVSARAAFATAMLVLSCGDGAVEPPPAPMATTVTISPGSVALTALGETARLTADVRDQNGQAMAGAAVGWATSDASIVAVDASGLATAAANGSAMITATAGAASDTAMVTVAQVVSAVAVSPRVKTLAAFGDTVRLLARAIDANGHGVLAVTEFFWSSSDTLVARVEASGLVTAVANGTTTITAAAGLGSGTVVVTVSQLASYVAVSPQTDTLVAFGDTVRLLAAATDANGHGMAGSEFSWRSSDTLVALVDASGLVTAAANGRATITAAADSVSGAAVVTVRQSVTSVQVSPASAQLTALGETVQLTAAAFDQNGYAVAEATFSWESRDSSVATVDTVGGVKAVGNSRYTEDQCGQGPNRGDRDYRLGRWAIGHYRTPSGSGSGRVASERYHLGQRDRRVDRRIVRCEWASRILRGSCERGTNSQPRLFRLVLG